MLLKKSMRKNKVIVILGTTSSGKTKLAVRLAKKFSAKGPLRPPASPTLQRGERSEASGPASGWNGAEIISADSRQVYQGMDIGTGKDLNDYVVKSEIRNLKSERKNTQALRFKFQDSRVPYHLIDVVSPKKHFTVAEWQKLAHENIEDILKRGKVPIVCGGTGLYISALTQGYQFPDIRHQTSDIRKRLGKLSLKQLLARLKKIDLNTYKIIDQNNRRRVQRALEIYYETGIPKSKRVGKQQPKFDFLKIGVTFSKAELDKRIDQRLEFRLTKGKMIEEVSNLHRAGLSWKRLEEFGLEYRWISRYLQKKISYDEMVKQLSKAIKDFAKRQKTWFKRDQEIKWLNNYSAIIREVKIFLQQ